MPAFFFISGLLVAQSLDHSTSRLNFLWKRFLRLYPAAIATVVLTACLIGPLVTSLPPKTYFTNPLLLRYLRTSLLVKIYFLLPGVFNQSPLGPSVNSSLWSLTLELKCYIGIFLAGFLPRRKGYPLLLTLLLGLLILSRSVDGPVESAGKAIFGPAFVLSPYNNLAAYFIIGALCYHLRYHIRIYPWWPAAIAVAGWATARPGLFDFAAYLLLPALLLWMAASGTTLLLPITPGPDLSYGLYLWAFPVEQLTINYLHPTSANSLFFLTLLITLPLAILSWYTVESPALKAKHRVQ